MKTISELMEGKTPGSVKIANTSWKPDEYFVPYFNVHGGWHGKDDTGDLYHDVDCAPIWKLYEGPKKKIKVWKWARQCLKFSSLVKYMAWIESDYFCDTEERFRQIELLPKRVEVMRLDYTMIEVDE